MMPGSAQANSPAISLAELAQLLDATVVGPIGLIVRQVRGIDDAGPGDLTFIANAKYLPKLQTTQATAVIVAPGVTTERTDLALLICRNPYLAFARILTHLQGPAPPPQGVLAGAFVHPAAEVDGQATIHPGCYVGAQAKVGRGSILHPGVVLYDRAEVGEDCLLHASVVVREGCRLGNRVIVQPGAVIGSDGFGYAPDGSRYVKIPQVGHVVIEDDVEIGAGSCIDRATLGVTRIGRGTKIDNLVQIAHNVVIGEDTVIVSQVGIAGSSEIGNHCTLGGQVGVAGHIKIGDNVMVGAKSGVSNNVEPRQVVSGTPVIPHQEWLKAAMSFAKLPDMRKELNRLRQQVQKLESIVNKG
jgi:UDP-3-O-[3-hydroxymyristoyl] glucosamine N-acyltransferase